MQAFILDVLIGEQWRRGGRTFWTHESAAQYGSDLIREKRAVKVRILPVEVSTEDAGCLPEPVEGQSKKGKAK